MAEDDIEMPYGLVLWPDETTGPWAVRVFFSIQDLVPVPVGISITSWRAQDADQWPTRHLPEPLWAGGSLPRVDGVLLRRLPVAELVRRAQKQIANDLNAHLLRYTTELTDAGEVSEAELRAALAMQAAVDIMDGKRRGGRDLGDEHYREVAAVYAAALQTGEPPTKAVQQRFGIEKSSAAKQVARARERGFLPRSPGRGRTGGLKGES
jgi:hypothetical protein